MNIFNKDISKYLFGLDRYTKKTIAIIIDVLLCVIAVWLAFFIRLEEFILLKDISFTPVLLSVVLAIPIFWIFGVYRTLFRYAGLSILNTISISTFVYGLVYFSIISIYGIKDIPRSVGILQPILLFIGVLSSRFLTKYLLTGTFNFSGDKKNKENILIYGAGSAGKQLLTSLENNALYKVVGILDDNPQLHRQYLLGQKIFNPNKIEDLKKIKDINLVLFAIPSIRKSKKNEIIKKLNKEKLVVKSLPNVNDIINDKISISTIKDFLADDLLVRDPVEPDQKLLDKNIKLKSVLVTGAGGTIGSELCRQIIKLNPKQLVLLELNEFDLYELYNELTELNKNLKIIPLLSNVQDQKKLEKIIETFKVNTIYHAAAYKHVPLVEANICEGVRNNVFGTLSVAKASINQKVQNLVLISSDKAVRPTNIMGVSKRLAELCMQSLHDVNDKINTNFSIVRFGNVINSSGSAIPKFRRQIREGGPITLTHPDVTRYFMTIPEASQLVIQAGALGKNAEVFLLDMGESVKIIDLIKRMINFSGLSIKDKDNKDGDIEIKIIGLRPGEKLYEELLIGDKPQKTNHLKIKMTDEPLIPFNHLEKSLDQLLNLLDNHQADEVKKFLEKTIKLYNSNSEITDYLHLEKEISEDSNDLLSENKKDNVVKLK
ncbi:polysaccharide biosynthesis protein [Candidatus Pelagibacter sp.]|nr:polysaccharide biosynthesis protein [Candidatus Pelagibacter sp.]